MTIYTNLLKELEKEFLPSEEKKTDWKKGLAFLLIGIAFGAGVFSLYLYIKKSPAGPAAVRLFSLGTPVETVTVKGVELTEVIGANGITTPAAAIEIKAMLSGKVLLLHVGVGASIKKGDILGQLDAMPYKTALQSAKAKLTKATEALEKDELFEKRMNELFSRRLLSDTELEKARHQLDMTRLYASEMEQAVSVAQLNLDRTVVIANAPGIIMEQNVTIGQIVQPGEALFRLGSTESMNIVVSVTEEKSDHIMTGQEADILLDAYPNTTLSGEVEKIEMGREQLLENGLTAQKMNVSIRLLSAWKMKTGLPAYVWIKSHRKGLTIPVMSLIQTPNGKFPLDKDQQGSVFIVENSKVRIQSVRIGITRKNSVEIIEGLQEGQEVVIRGASNLRENDRIESTSRRSG
ncbi:MAG: efflux RND transporter periplasmic adaptor subunit [Nitrospirota bacterium]